MKLFISIIVAVLLTNTLTAKELSKKKVTPQALYLKASDAFNFITEESSKILFIDVRTQEEIEFVGSTSLMDKNIPYVVKNLNKWDEKKKRFTNIKNKSFIDDVEKELKIKGLSKDSKIVFICRSGSRSAKAAREMFKLGYKNVYTITDGFEGGISKKTKHRTINGWKNAGNPWTYRLNKSKAYITN